MSKKIEQMTALVVENQNQVANIVSSILRNDIGFKQVLTLTDGAKAWHHINNEGADWIFCSWDVPEMNGIELLQHVRAKEGMEELPFIMMSSRSDKASLLEAAGHGVTDYIVKPFSPAIVKSKFSNYLTRKERRVAERVAPKQKISCQLSFDGKHRYQGVVSNISHSGCLLEMEVFSKGGTIYDSGRLSLNAGENSVELQVELVRTQALEDHREQTIMGAAFKYVGVSSAQQMMINQLLTG